jgi:hypothetical protein
VRVLCVTRLCWNSNIEVRQALTMHVKEVKLCLSEKSQ